MGVGDCGAHGARTAKGRKDCTSQKHPKGLGVPPNNTEPPLGWPLSFWTPVCSYQATLPYRWGPAMFAGCLYVKKLVSGRVRKLLSGEEEATLHWDYVST